MLHLLKLKNINIVRKFVVASKTIKKGEYFSKENLKIKRSGQGLSILYWKILGKKSDKNYKKDDIFK